MHVSVLAFVPGVWVIGLRWEIRTVTDRSAGLWVVSRSDVTRVNTPRRKTERPILTQIHCQRALVLVEKRPTGFHRSAGCVSRKNSQRSGLSRSSERIFHPAGQQEPSRSLAAIIVFPRSLCTAGTAV
ncbi:electron transfer flavoprotein subunit alpha [Anopheles sinensis]|uniref:Electron transfer flavoprotein subunit alpha n=1 Tax=Anopheles sinensis TaxID=74873 RepID=A0A084VEE7_ANOSI|nr:electron transfer flavoprotein subunit alpha [Anopheles sinensis]